jgi:glutamyl-Q tRNA(Asp) synthetase
MPCSIPTVFRFAPSPNGRLHLGHAYSALMNEQMAASMGARLLLRIEDIDAARCTRAFEQGIVDDLAWLGVAFEAAPRRQSEHLGDYGRALDALASRGLIYCCACLRADIARRAGGLCDPDGAALHIGRCSPDADATKAPALRLDMARALQLAPGPLRWREYREGGAEALENAQPEAWGDVLLKRRDAPASYHFAVVVDDASQSVTDVARGRDLFQATSIHRLLQELLEIASPRYRHHRLVCEPANSKLSKSAGSMALAELRRKGVTPGQIRAALGFARACPASANDQLTLAATVAPDAGVDVGAALGAWAIN